MYDKTVLSKATGISVGIQFSFGNCHGLLHKADGSTCCVGTGVCNAVVGATVLPELQEEALPPIWDPALVVLLLSGAVSPRTVDWLVALLFLLVFLLACFLAAQASFTACFWASVKFFQALLA